MNVKEPDALLVTFFSGLLVIVKPLRLFPTRVDQLTGTSEFGVKPNPVTLTVVPTVATFGETLIRGPDVAVVWGTTISGMTAETCCT